MKFDFELTAEDADTVVRALRFAAQEAGRYDHSSSNSTIVFMAKYTRDRCMAVALAMEKIMGVKKSG